MADEKKKPVRVLRIGDVSVSLFLQNGALPTSRGFHTVSLQKSFVDREGERQYTSSLSLAELPAAIEALRMALRYIVDECGEATIV
jgi:hypothetical protein